MTREDDTDKKHWIEAEKLKNVCRAILDGAGVPGGHSEIISDNLIFADLRGVSSHGTVKLRAYINKIKAGSMSARTELQVLKENASTILIDAGNGFGQIAGLKAMQFCISKAGRNGIGIAGIRNSNNFGAAAYLALEAVKHGMIGIVLSNAAPTVPPWGGTQALLSTNPIAVAVPAGKEEPIVLDMATTVVARGKIRLALRNKEKIPTNWAVNSAGEPTDDPVEALQGFLLPIGGAKGYGLSLVISILTGILCSPLSMLETNPLDDASSASNFSHFLMAIDIESFVPISEFQSRIDRLIGQIHACPRQTGIERVYLPGEPEYRKAIERDKSGIPLSSSVVREIESMASEVGLTVRLRD